MVIFFFFYSSHPPSSSGEDALLPKAPFFSVCLLVLSACCAVGVWYHEECRSKFGVRGFDVITYQWLDCRFVKSLPQFIETTFLRTSQRRFFWHDNDSLSTNKRSTQQYTPTCSHTNALSFSLAHSHIPTQIMNQLLITA